MDFSYTQKEEGGKGGITKGKFIAGGPEGAGEQNGSRKGLSLQVKEGVKQKGLAWTEKWRCLKEG